MKAVSLQVIKKELKHRSPEELVTICLRLARHKKENKELLDYLLFDSENEALFVDSVKEYMDELFLEINKSNIYFVKKGIQKALRAANKYIRYSGNKQTAVELLIYFCLKVQALGINISRSKVLENSYVRQVSKIEKHLETLHEDIRLDYEEELIRIKSL